MGFTAISFKAGLLALFLSYTAALPTLKANETWTPKPGYYVGTDEQKIKLVGYINNFKKIMTDYVKTQYSNLTVNEMAQVENTLQDFLSNFSNDLRMIIDNESNMTDTKSQVVNDGHHESHFKDMKNRISSEFPHLSQNSVDNIVYSLRTNLLTTRNKLDQIIQDSKMAAKVNST